MKRLRIRQRAPVSEANVDYLAGHHTGTDEGYKAGKAHIVKLYDEKIREMEEEVRELQKKLRKEEISFGQLAHKHNEKVGECVRLSQEVAMLRAREDATAHSDMLFLPPFEAQATPWKDPKALALRNEQLPPTRAKRERIEALRRMYGGSPVGAMVGEGRSLFDWQTDPEMVRQFRSQMDRAFNAPPTEPPGNPMVHIDFAQAESRTAIAMRDRAILDTSIFRTDRAGGHSHVVDVGVQLDPDVRAAVNSLERFREAFGNAGISAETMVRMLDRLASLEERVEEQAPSRESEEEINLGVRSSPPGEE